MQGRSARSVVARALSAGCDSDLSTESIRPGSSLVDRASLPLYEIADSFVARLCLERLVGRCSVWSRWEGRFGRTRGPFACSPPWLRGVRGTFPRFQRGVCGC